MKRTPSHNSTKPGQIPTTSAEANALQRLVDLWFAGNVTHAARAFGITYRSLRRYLSGHQPVSRPMLAKMIAFDNDRQERQRRIKEQLQSADREAAIQLARQEIHAAVEASLSPRDRQRIEIGARKNGIAARRERRKKRAAQAAP